MAFEVAAQRTVRKPWGRVDLHPWRHGIDGDPVGEIWFELSDPAATKPALMLKLLFTDQPLSIQVHPDDAFAHKLGLPNGKTEAWYVLSALPGAEVTLGLDRSLTAPELREAILDGKIAEFAHRQVVHAGEALLVPAGTIHAIGAGLVIAEVQQNSEITFRLFDYGRDRELHPEAAVGAAIAGPAAMQASPLRLSAERLVVARSPYFVVEHVDLPPRSQWDVVADRETWILLLAGSARFDRVPVARGEAVFLDSRSVGLEVDASAVGGLLVYVGNEPQATLLQRRR